jgi:hypothetical protein
VPYELRTDLLGVVVRHAGECPARDGRACRCGPLGFRAGVWDWDADRWVFGPLVSTAADAREWQRAANGVDEAEVEVDVGANPREQLAWWAFCYVGLGFVGLAVGLGTSALTG